MTSTHGSPPPPHFFVPCSAPDLEKLDCKWCIILLEHLPLASFYESLTCSNRSYSVLISISSITPDIKEFCIGEFLPELRLATANFNLPQEEFLRLEGNTYSTLIKLLYAFLWQVSKKSRQIGFLWQVSSVFDNFLTSDNQLIGTLAW